ncbi:MAG: zinc ribbon domain-containing protein [Mariprofundaceae bacterium]|nr:zinc ribbon domain-containing protein [Mariprofundaceae bacterium]
MSIQLCPQCQRGMKDDEQICPACGASLAVYKAGETWLRQIKVYVASIIVGIILLVMTMPKIIHHGHVPADQGLLAIAIAGGMASMGGLFGLCVALFFYYLWKNKSVDKHKK